MTEVIGWTAMCLGLAFLIVAAIGVVRLPDAFQRMHASTKAGTLGATLTIIGAVLVEPDIGVGTAGLTILFMLATLSVAAQLLGRAAYMSGATLTGLIRDDPLASELRREESPLEERLDSGEPGGTPPHAGR
jgi:multicomponent Na+:H+ antiporter subunit G